MDKATKVTDTKTLWGEDPDKRNSCCASICLNYSHFICLDSKNNTGVGGGEGETLPYKPVRDVLFFRVSFFSINS